VVGGVAGLAAEAGVPIVAIAGEIYDGASDRIEAVSLTARFGEDRSRHDTVACVEAVTAELLAGSGARARR
jgi:glycerate kinase